MANLGIIDIGSNSIRLVLFETGRRGNYKIVNDLKESVRLEEGMLGRLDIAEGKIEQAIQVLKLFKAMCTANAVEEIIAIGTQALRTASNRDAFLERVEAETGISIRVLTGEEEAYFDFVGVARSMRTTDCLIMDMGGGSTELIWCRNGELLHSISLPLGAINLTYRFNLRDEVKEDQVKNLHKFLQKSFDEVPWLRQVSGDVLIGIGGSMRNIGKIDRRRKNYPLEINHGYAMDKADVNLLARLLAGKNLKSRLEVKGLAGDRADIIVGPALTLAYLMEYCGLQSVVVGGNGLREGYLMDNLGGDLGEIRGALDFSVYNTLYNYSLNTRHAENVYRLSQALFQQLAELHDLGDEWEIILKTAALLHHCGMKVLYYNYHEHSFYLILNCGLRGLSHRELLLSAYVAAAHNKDNYRVDVHRYQQIISAGDVTAVHQLGLIIKIAEGLDRGMSGNTEGVECSILKDTVVIKTISSTSNSLEIMEAMKSSAYFKKVFRRKLIIV